MQHPVLFAATAAAATATVTAAAHSRPPSENVPNNTNGSQYIEIRYWFIVAADLSIAVDPNGAIKRADFPVRTCRLPSIRSKLTLRVNT